MLIPFDISQHFFTCVCFDMQFNNIFVLLCFSIIVGIVGNVFSLYFVCIKYLKCKHSIPQFVYLSGFDKGLSHMEYIYDLLDTQCYDVASGCNYYQLYAFLDSILSSVSHNQFELKQSPVL